jgi:hypothetical protein
VDGDAFDAWLRQAMRDGSRRGVLRRVIGALAAALLGFVGRSTYEEVEAAQHRRRTPEWRHMHAGSHDRSRVRSSGQKHKKNCPPCKKRKDGKCKKNKPDGTVCEGGTCQSGSCVQPVPPLPPPGGLCPPEEFRCGYFCCPAKTFPVCCAPDFNPDGASCWPPGYQCCVPVGGGACGPDQTCCPGHRFAPRATCATPELGEHCCDVTRSGGFCAADEECCPSELFNSENIGCCPTGATCCNDTTDCDESAGEACLGGCCGERSFETLPTRMGISPSLAIAPRPSGWANLDTVRERMMTITSFALSAGVQG